jgi:hypothetical protein
MLVPRFSLLLPLLLLGLALSALAAAQANAASVAYIENHNLVLSSPDGVHKKQLTDNGTSDAPWTAPAQGADGKTVVAHKDTFENNSKRPVLYLYGPDGKLVTANVMPVYSGANIPVYPIGLALDWESQTVAYGYSYCTFACQGTVKGYWLTFADHQSLYPSDPQGASDSFNPTFYGQRVVSSDSGGRIFVQPDNADAPFTTSYQSWLAVEGTYLSRVSISMQGNWVGIEWNRYVNQVTEYGIAVARHQGTVPSDLSDICDVATAANPRSLSFSPDGTQMAWRDDDGIKVAGVPNGATAEHVCTLSAPAKVISEKGIQPSFGGADVAAMLAKPGGQTPGAGQGAGTPGSVTSGTGSGPGADKPAPLVLGLPKQVSAASLAKGVAVSVPVPAAGKVTVSGTVDAKLARRLGLTGSAKAALAALAKRVTVATGASTAKAAGTVQVKLKLTAKARRKVKKLRGATLTLTATQGAASGTAKVRLR